MTVSVCVCVRAGGWGIWDQVFEYTGSDILLSCIICSVQHAFYTASILKGFQRGNKAS